jgi:hypothetical protein
MTSFTYQYDAPSDQLRFLNSEVERLNTELAAARAMLDHLQNTIHAMSHEMSKRATYAVKVANSTHVVAMALFKELQDFNLKHSTVLAAAIWLKETMGFMRNEVFPEIVATTLGEEAN